MSPHTRPPAARSKAAGRDQFPDLGHVYGTDVRKSDAGRVGGHTVGVPLRILTPAAEASFVAYAHYLEDLAGVISGAFGHDSGGVYAAMRLHPPARALPPRMLDAAEMRDLHDALRRAWTALAAVHNAVEVADRQANAVIPDLAFTAVTASGQGLGLALGDPDVAGTAEDALALLADAAAEEIFPYPWSAVCLGCPQLGTTVYGGGVLPGEAVSVFHTPHAGTSDARVAMLLRTTRQRVVEREFARLRQTDVRPGRSRRNLSREHKEAVAAALAPTTLFDVFDRIRLRVAEDDGAAFVDAPFDDVEALRLSAALALVADASVAVIEAAIASVIGWETLAELVDSQARRAPAAPIRQRSIALRNLVDSSS